MALSFLDNIDYRGRKPNFTRDLFNTKADMAAFNENYLPDVFIASCVEDGRVYVFNRANDVDPVLGKWRALLDGNPEVTPLPGGGSTSTTTVGGVPITVTYGPDGTPTGTSIDGIPVSGTTITSTPGTDSNGNPTNTTTTITVTPSGPVTTTVTTGGGSTPDGGSYTTTTTTTGGGGTPPRTETTVVNTPPGGGSGSYTTTITTGGGGTPPSSEGGETTPSTPAGGIGTVITITGETDEGGNPIGEPETSHDIVDGDGDSLLLTEGDIDDLFADLDW